MHLIVDTREQKPYSEAFSKLGIGFTVKTLGTGDYSILGYEDQFAVERKTLADFIQSITWDRSRFSRELERARNYKFFAVVIEGSFYDMMNHNYRAKVHPNSVISTYLKWMVKYGCPFILADSRNGAILCVVKLAEAYLKDKIYWEEKEKEKEGGK